MRRIVITGMGVVSSLGTTIEEFWNNLLKGEARIHANTKFDSSQYRSARTTVLAYSEIANQLSDDEGRYNLCTAIGMLAINQALVNAGLTDPELIRQAGLSLATTSGGDLDEYIKSVHFKLPRADHLLDNSQIFMPAAHIVEKFSLQGPVCSFSSACTSGTVSLAYACDSIKYSDTNIMIAGGTDILQDIAFAGFNSLRVVSKNDCRPFDARRTGIVIGDGAAFLILEEYEAAKKRGAPILVEILGSGMSCDAHHATKPIPEGAAQAMQTALKQARIQPGEIGYINCHGTGTKANDSSEATAMYQVFRDELKKIYAGSTKSALGHLLGTAGSIEAIITVLALCKGLVPPMMNLESADETVHFQIAQGRPALLDSEYAMSNSFGFGGNNISMVFKKLSE